MLETSSIGSYFSELGFSKDAAAVYIMLHSRGAQSMSELARRCGVERTHLYRLITELEEAQLVTAQKLHGRTILQSAPIANLHLLLNRKEQEVKDMQDKLWVIERLLANNSLNSPATRVQFYQGAEGLRQMFWNETEAGTENLAILYENMQNKTEAGFFKRWVQQCNQADIRFRGIIGPQFIASQQKWYSEHDNERIKNWEARIIPPEVFTITHSQVIYDNVVAYYVWKDAEIFGVEIYNQQIADAQRSFFEMLWRQGQTVNDLTGTPALLSSTESQS